MNRIPDEILQDETLQEAVNLLPKNYDFEIFKTIWRIRKDKFRRVALQFPDGLLLFALPIASIIERFTEAETVIIGDVTYGACCIEDTAAFLVGCDLIVHYGHSCLIPIDELPSGMKALYVFVRISIDPEPISKAIKLNLEGRESNLLLCGTIQFTSALPAIRRDLEGCSFDSVVIPQSKPLSPGEILGCTAPTVVETNDKSAIVYIGDGRFHLEAMMIANPQLTAYQYDPYSEKLTLEKYDHERMLHDRKAQLEAATKAKRWGIMFGTLGRQGSPRVLKNIEDSLTERKLDYVTCISSEINEYFMKQFSTIECWVQIACPRLSIDWGYSFSVPLLNPYEAMVCLRKSEWKSPYPMDFYAYESNGNWTPNNVANRPVRIRRRPLHPVGVR